MRILFDHQVFSWQAYGGISRYFFEIAKGLRAAGQEALLPDGFMNENVYLRSLENVRFGPSIPLAFKGKKWLQERWGRRFSLQALDRSRPDVFHPTYFADYFVPRLQARGIPFVLTVHDMIHEIYRHGGRGFFSLDKNVVENKRRLAVLADAVIAVSEHTRRDMLKWIPDLDPGKIHVIHHGNSMPAFDAARRMNLPERYLFFVGQRKSYKNFLWMLEALADLFAAERDLQLVCAGGGRFDAEETAAIQRLGLAGRVRQPVIHSDRDLAELYTRAQCFLFPSQYEGFGIPVLEAFACNCPVVLNAASSLPEVGGSAALYFHDEDSLRAAVRLVLHDAAERSNRIALGVERNRLFSWEKSANAHLELYKKVADSR